MPFHVPSLLLKAAEASPSELLVICTAAALLLFGVGAWVAAGFIGGRPLPIAGRGVEAQLVVTEGVRLKPQRTRDRR